MNYIFHCEKTNVWYSPKFVHAKCQNVILINSKKLTLHLSLFELSIKAAYISTILIHIF